MDPQWTKYALASVAFLHRHYFRTEVTGVRNVPTGRVLLVANHSGQIPIDGAIIGASLFMDVEPPRFMRAMVEKWTQTLPFVPLLLSRVGQVVGIPENAMRLLESEEALLVFPRALAGSRSRSRSATSSATSGLVSCSTQRVHTLRFEPAPAPSHAELQETLANVYARVVSWLERRGLFRDDHASNGAPPSSPREAMTLAGMQRGTLETTSRASGCAAT
jgi:hypothetical protein